LLSTEAQQPAWSTATSGPIIEYHTFVLKEDVTEIDQPAALEVLEREILPMYVPPRRWFQAKDRQISRIKVEALGRLPGDDNLLYAEIGVLAGDSTARYTLPMSVAWEGDPPSPFETPLALARIRKGRRVGLLTDGFASPRFSHALVENIAKCSTAKLRDGELQFQSTDALKLLNLAPREEIEWPGAEQSNSTLVIGRKAVLKLFRRLSPGIHPEAEMTRYLTERGFSGTPALLGDVTRVDAKGERATVAVLQGYVPNQGDGWPWTLQQLGRLVDEGATPYAESTEPHFESYAAFARVIGRRVGEMHLALASENEDPAFAPEKVDAAGAKEVARRAVAQFDRALSAIDAIEFNDEQDARRCEALKSRRSSIVTQIERLASKAKGTLATRIHGDLHLGQLLVSGADVMIIDFEGEPSKPLDERRSKMSPLRDLAGIIRSFDYAASSVERTSRQAEGGEGSARAKALLDQFRLRAEIALLEGYRKGARRVLTDGEFDLLRLFMIEKAAYEIAYEAANRPDWLSTPLCGLSALTEKAAKRTEPAYA
jgi:maltose alpha-D-glucosyltransferase/alpha-amylase